ncbi:hypothetical protein AB0I69_33620 [Streptomyces sp. NPDC050508]|uniref:hypothetical protein n=1 Tax=Streptomyces sp. NPDC050508 TaxID=3155405 RepID=UPI003439A7F5
MNARRILVVLLLSILAFSCTSSTGHEIPKAICGTPVDPALTRPLVNAADDFHEFTRVERSKAITAPCALLEGRDPVLEFRFSWDDTKTDLMYLALDTGTISRVTEPRSIDFAYKTIVGTDGAISTTPCKTDGGDYFTLTVQVPQIGLMDHTHRKDIEKFMRAYFPATIKTLGCR